MFGYAVANWKELSKEQQSRYGGVYCGICRRIGRQSSQMARLGLRYDMAFLALLLMSLYEPEEASGPLRCAAHPFRRRDWVDNEFVRYAADMNTALAYYKLRDDWNDDGRYSAKLAAKVFRKSLPDIEARYPRQCRAMGDCIQKLSELERDNCPNPDEPAGCFGALMGELLAFEDDLWREDLYQMGFSLGRFIYLADAAMDYAADKKKGKYNPYLAMGMEEDWHRWEEYLVLALGKCTYHYEKLPLVQDKGLLDNILYSGVWTALGRRNGEEREEP